MQKEKRNGHPHWFLAKYSSQRFQQQGSSEVPARFHHVPARVHQVPAEFQQCPNDFPARFQVSPRWQEGSRTVLARLQRLSSKVAARLSFPVFQSMHFAGTTPRPKDWNPRGSLLGSCSKVLRKVTAGLQQGCRKVPARFQQGSRKVQARFQQGWRKVPARFQQGSSKVPARFQQGSRKVPARFQEGSSKVALNSCKHVCRSPLLFNVLDVSIYVLIQYKNSLIKRVRCINIFHNTIQ